MSEFYPRKVAQDGEEDEIDYISKDVTRQAPFRRQPHGYQGDPHVASYSQCISKGQENNPRLDQLADFNACGQRGKKKIPQGNIDQDHRRHAAEED